jgi:hypothetical protein
VGFRDRSKAKAAKPRFSASVDDLDKARLQDRYCGVDVTSIGDAPMRTPVRLRGEIQGIKVVPRTTGGSSIEATITDGTGKAIAIFLGRRHIAGLAPGRGVIIEGVGRRSGGRTVVLNPAYTLLAS